MPNTARIVLFAACWSVAGAAAAADDEALIEQLLARHAPTAAPKPHRSAKPDPLTVWLDREVRVDTVDHGLYLGVLRAVTADSVTLDIALPKQSIRYLLPRAAIAAVVPREAGAP